MTAKYSKTDLECQSNREERLARKLCKFEDVDPDKETVGLGSLIPEGEKYALWRVRLPIVRLLMEEQT